MTSLPQPPPEASLPPYAGERLDIECLFEPVPLGPVTLKNRFVMPGMQRGWCSDGAPRERLVQYYRARAEAEVAMIISESCAIDHPSATAQAAAATLTPRTASAWERCVHAVRGTGCEMLIQLWHEGALRKDQDGLTRSPSGLAYPGRLQGKPFTESELGELLDAYVRTALLAQALGATGVELHCGHGYLLDLFLWQETNLRSDGYGGSEMAQRARFPIEIIEAIRRACGPDFLISVRFSQWKQYDYAAKVAPSQADLEILVSAFGAAGANVLHPSARRFWTAEWMGSDLSLAGWTRRLSNMPTIAVGSVGLNKDVMESLIDDGSIGSTIEQSLSELTSRLKRREFDIVAVGRSLIGDAEWVRKTRDGRFDEIRPFRREDLDSLKWEA